MASDTKEKILAAALEMFSRNGYAGTNIRELSASLGLVKSGVYKHYASKEAPECRKEAAYLDRGAYETRGIIHSRQRRLCSGM